MPQDEPDDRPVASAGSPIAPREPENFATARLSHPAMRHKFHAT